MVRAVSDPVRKIWPGLHHIPMGTCVCLTELNFNRPTVMQYSNSQTLERVIAKDQTGVRFIDSISYTPDKGKCEDVYKMITY